MTNHKPKSFSIDKASVKITQWIGTPISIVVHSLIFLTFTLVLLTGFNFEKVLLVWNTMVSLEAIYLAIFIQMTVNRNTQSLEGVEDDIEDIQEDVEELGEDVEDISEDIEDIQEEDKEDEVIEAKTQESLSHIQKRLQSIMNEVESLKKITPHPLPH